MPADSEYDRVPLLFGNLDLYDNQVLQDRGSSSKEKDANENLIIMNHKELSNEHLPEIKIQLHPEEVIANFKNFPKERRKAGMAFGLMAGGFICNSVSIVLTHQKVPDRELHPPLPDITLDNFTKHKWLNDVADILVILCTIGCVGVIVLHRHRWILLRRVCCILSILYLMRSFTMYATVLPLANDHVYCSPKMNTTSSFGQSVLIVTEEVIKLVGAGGLPITGRKTLCGDYIFSGHTIIVMMAYLLTKEYVPKRYASLHWISWGAAWLGMVCLLLSHGHYTIDVMVAYYATTRMFWMYHTFSNHNDLKRKTSSNSLSEVWWFPLLQYFEGNVKGPLPKEFAVPRIKAIQKNHRTLGTRRE